MYKHLKSKFLGDVIPFLILGMIAPIAAAQTDIGVHSHLGGQTYRDDKIDVTAPEYWSVTVLTWDKDLTNQRSFDKGATLRHGRYILTLCTGCNQTSGVQGGRFGEISSLVQPWFRDEQPGLPCGSEKISRVSTEIDRVDLWYTRNVAHPSDMANNDCHEPRTTATVWYGSYFTQHCLKTPTEEDCGGYFLYNLTYQPTEGLDEMAFGLTYDTTDPNQLPRKNDPELTQVLSKAAAIVASVHYHKSPPLQTPSH